MSSVPMVPGSSYVDFQGTQYSVAASGDPAMGALFVAITGRKFYVMPCDAARMNDGKFECNLTGTPLWLQMWWGFPMGSKFVPA